MAMIILYNLAKSKNNIEITANKNATVSSYGRWYGCSTVGSTVWGMAWGVRWGMRWDAQSDCIHLHRVKLAIYIFCPIEALIIGENTT